MTIEKTFETRAGTIYVQPSQEVFLNKEQPEYQVAIACAAVVDWRKDGGWVVKATGVPFHALGGSSDDDPKLVAEQASEYLQIWASDNGVSRFGIEAPEHTTATAPEGGRNPDEQLSNFNLKTKQ